MNSSAGSTGEATALFEEQRRLLFGVAYRMLGSASEAEDMVQEAWLRWQRAGPGGVRSPRSFLVTTVTRLCIDRQKSARVRREQYLGPWLPEPVATEQLVAPHSPESTVDAMESISFAFMVLLERLGPVERAVFLLRDVFDYDYTEIAPIVVRSEATCRQILRRARAHLAGGRARFAADEQDRLRLTNQFIQAAGAGDLGGLLQLLAQDAIAYSDGGGKVVAATNPVIGGERVARFIIGIARKNPASSVRLADLNGGPAIVLAHLHGDVTVLILAVANGVITAVNLVRNHEKLAHITTTSPDLRRSPPPAETHADGHAYR